MDIAVKFRQEEPISFVHFLSPDDSNQIILPRKNVIGLKVRNNLAPGKRTAGWRKVSPGVNVKH